MSLTMHRSLWEIWEYLSDNPKLVDIAKIHKGLEWNIPLKKNLELLVSSVPRVGFKKGLDKAHGKLECYYAHGFVYLNVEKKFSRTSAHFLPWERPKVIANAQIIGRGPWRVCAFPDREGLVCYHNLTGIWPRDALTIEAIAAILNSSLANAALFVQEGKRDNKIRSIESIPIPPLEILDYKKIDELVQGYQKIRSERTDSLCKESDNREFVKYLREIDGLILKAYDLPPRLERQLLDFFRGYPRPVPFPFPDYFPADFKPCIPLYQYLKMDMKQTSAGKLLKRIEPIDSEAIHEFVLDLEERQA